MSQARGTEEGTTDHVVTTGIAVSGYRGWVRLYVPEADFHMSMSPSAAMQLAQELIKNGWDQS